MLPDRDPTRAPRLDELRTVVASLPELGELLQRGAAVAGESVARATATMWDGLGLHTTPPSWGPGEHAAACTVLACACAAPGPAAPDWLPGSLRRISAAQIARVLTGELARGETVWLRALGGRYGSLRHRCAPRTALRSRGLADLVRSDDRCRAAIVGRLEAWLAAGGTLATLPGELEAAIVHARTPSRLA